MFWFVPYISDPVWNFTYVAYSLTSSKPAKNTKGQCFWHTPSINYIFTQLYTIYKFKKILVNYYIYYNIIIHSDVSPRV